MNGLERQLSALLKEAPGEPPATIDADALIAGRPRRRLVAPILAAAAVVAVAVPVAVFVTRGSTTSPPGPRPSVSVAADPKAQAIRRIEAALQQAPLPPGAQRGDKSLDRYSKGQFTTSTSPNEVRRTGWWTAPGTTTAAIGYVTSHRPDGMHVDSTGSGGGTQVLDLATTPAHDAQYGLELDYVVAPYRSGVAIRVDAWTVWVPIRPAWSYIPNSMTSVDVTVEREAISEPKRGGAPTVRQTMTDGAARRLARAVNALSAEAPEGMHSCPGSFVRASDVVEFHMPAGEIRIARATGGCMSNAIVTTPNQGRQAYLNGGDFEHAVLAALGLPDDYGGG